MSREADCCLFLSKAIFWVFIEILFLQILKLLLITVVSFVYSMYVRCNDINNSLFAEV